MCNFMFVDATAKLGQPEITLGVFAPPASVILPLKIGQTRADDLLLTGRTISGEQAHTIGLATTLYDDRAAMMTGLDEWVAKRILPKSASSLKFANRAARTNFVECLRVGLASLESLYVNELMVTHDANEGIESFLQRCQPEWTDN